MWIEEGKNRNHFQSWAHFHSQKIQLCFHRVCESSQRNNFISLFRISETEFLRSPSRQLDANGISLFASLWMCRRRNLYTIAAEMTGWSKERKKTEQIRKKRKRVGVSWHWMTHWVNAGKRKSPCVRSNTYRTSIFLGYRFIAAIT